MAPSRWFGPHTRERLAMIETLKQHLAQEPNVVPGTAYTPLQQDIGRTVLLNAAAATTVTIKAGEFTTGQKLRLVQANTGLVTLAPGAGVTLNTPTTLKSGGRWATITVEFTSPTSAILSGLLAAA